MDCFSLLKVLIKSGGVNNGFFVFGCFSIAVKVFWLFLVLCLSLKFLQFSLSAKGFVQFLWDCRRKSGNRRNGFCSKANLDDVFEPKVAPLKRKSVALSGSSKSANKNRSSESKESVNSSGESVHWESGSENGGGDDGNADVVALRRMVKVGRKRADAAFLELEKERMAAASAADEAMAMILRLQGEKSSLEIEANQYRKMAVQRQEYDQEVIQSLQWIIMKHECERSKFEEKLRLCLQELKQHMDSDEVDEMLGPDPCFTHLDFSMENGLYHTS